MSLRRWLAVAALLPVCAVNAQPAIDLPGLSSEVSPCIDFDQHVNGKWQSSESIPAHRARIGSFDDLRDQSRAIVEAALAEALEDPSLLDTRGKRLAADYYASGINLPAVERRGLQSLAPVLSEVDALKPRTQLPRVLATLARYRIAAAVTSPKARLRSSVPPILESHGYWHASEDF